MKKYLRLAIGLVIVAILLLGFRNQVFSESIETGDSNSSTTVINNVNNTEIECDCEETPTPTLTPVPTTNPTPTPTLIPVPTTEPTVVPTNTPSIGGPGDGKSDGRSDGKSDGRSSFPQTGGQVLGASTGPQVLGLSTTSGGNTIPQLAQLFGALISGITGFTFFKKND